MEAASLALLIAKYAKTTLSVLIVNTTSGFTIMQWTSLKIKTTICSMAAVWCAEKDAYATLASNALSAITVNIVLLRPLFHEWRLSLVSYWLLMYGLIRMHQMCVLYVYSYSASMHLQNKTCLKCP
jgi:hypothetical protein